jgi:tetratricopeptide (TPR) repeat protein
VKYRQAAAAYQEKRYREAIDLFLEADQLAPSAALSFNIARAYEKIDDVAAALRWYRDYVRRTPGTADSEVREIIQKLEGRLEKKGVQQVTIRSEPPRATVVLDGQPVGVTPWTGELAPGTHRAELQLTGRATATRSFELDRSHALDVEVTLPEAAPVPAPAPAPVPPPPAVQSAPPPAPAREPSDDQARRQTLTTYGWVGVAAGGAALGGALVFELLRRGAESDAKNQSTQIGYADAVDTMHARQTTARVLAVTGVALAAAGGVLLWLGREPHASGEMALGFGCAPGGCGTAVRGRF